MARRRKKSNGSRKRRIPLLGIPITARIGRLAGWQEAFNYDSTVPGAHPTNHLWVMGDDLFANNYQEIGRLAIGYTLMKRTFGPVPLVAGKKFAITLF
jgi:hypothetical protein